MKLTISPAAAHWYRREFDLQAKDYIQFNVRLYGSSIHPNFSLGIANQPPREMAIQAVVDGITFYFDEQDAWFLQDHRLHVTLVDDDIEFIFEPS